MRKEDVKVGMKVRVLSNTYYDESDGCAYTASRAMVGSLFEVRYVGATLVWVWTADKSDWWYFKVSDLEPAEPPQVPSVTINGIVYVPEGTIKTPEPAPAQKFFWGQWVKVECDDRPAMVLDPALDVDGDIRVVFLGEAHCRFRRSERCTPIGA